MNPEKSISLEPVAGEILKNIEDIRQNQDWKMQRQLWDEFFEKYQSCIPHVNFSDNSYSVVLYKLPDGTFILNKPCFWDNEKYNQYKELDKTEAIEEVVGQIKEYNSKIEDIENRKKEISKFSLRHLEEKIIPVTKDSKVLPFL